MYVTTEFRGHNAVGVAAYVVAESPERAAELLNQSLRAAGLDDTSVTRYSMRLVSLVAERAVILNDGDY